MPIIQPQQRAGRTELFQFTIATAANFQGYQGIVLGNVVGQVPISYLTVGNSFYVIDSPFPLVIRTDVTPRQYYPTQCGEGFPQNLGHVWIDGVSSEVPVDTTTIWSARIWLGWSSQLGFIDNRALVDYNNVTDIERVTGTTGTSIGIAAVAQAIPLPANTNNFRNTGIIVSNTSATQPIYLTDVVGNYIGTVPANSSQTFPGIVGYLTTGGMSPRGGNLYFSNPGVAAVNVVVSVILQSNSFGM
jgi:hypothetical protein